MGGEAHVQATQAAAEPGEGTAPAEPMDMSGNFAFDAAAAAAAAAHAGMAAHQGCAKSCMCFLRSVQMSPVCITMPRPRCTLILQTNFHVNMVCQAWQGLSRLLWHVSLTERGSVRVAI